MKEFFTILIYILIGFLLSLVVAFFYITCVFYNTTASNPGYFINLPIKELIGLLLILFLGTPIFGFSVFLILKFIKNVKMSFNSAKK